MRAIDEAAGRLLAQLGVPPGAANTLAVDDGLTSYITVLIDTNYRHWLKAPSSFEGYPVMVKPRERATSYR